MSSSLTYVYCLVQSARRPSLRGVPRGMPGGSAVRILEVAGVAGQWLVVSSVPESEYGEAALQDGLHELEWVGPRAVAHEAMVEHFLRADAVLPMQLFTLFTDDARAVEHVVRDRRRIAGILSRIAGRVEWGLRLTWEGIGSRTTGGRGRATGRAARPVRSGAEYLAQKRELRDRSRAGLERARRETERVYRAVARQTAKAVRRAEVERAAPGSPLLLDAAFLVPASRGRTFAAAVRRHAAPLKRAGVTLSLTGPWPPYNFI